MPKRIPTLPAAWEEFCASVLLHLALPLMPLLIELLLHGELKPTTVSITAALYTLAIGLSSRSPTLLGLSIISAVVFSVTFGISSASAQALAIDPMPFAAGGIAFIFGCHLIERYNRHVVERHAFWAFKEKPACPTCSN